MAKSEKNGHHTVKTKIALVVFALLTHTAWSDQFGPFTYTDHGNYIEITDYPTDATGVVDIPSSLNAKPVTHIGNWAFAFCSDLTRVVLPFSLTTIGDSAFSYCSSLSSVSISPSVHTISKSAFNRCSALMEIVVHPDNFDFSSQDGLLFNKSKDSLLRCPEGYSGSYVVPSSVTTIADSSFDRCSGLVSIVIANSVVSIGDSAFSNCGGLTSVIIPSSVSAIGCSPFYGCDELIEIVVQPDNLRFCSEGGFLFDIDKSVVIQCPGAYTGSYTIPSTISVIGSGAFRDCSGLTNVIIPVSVSVIGDSAFSNCYGLTRVTIPESVATIGDAAFYNRGNPPPLRQVIFLGNAPTIGEGIFYTSLPGTIVYAFDEASGFTLPDWAGVPVMSMGTVSPIPPWLLEKGLAHDSDVDSDFNGDGVTLLMAYALNLDPHNARPGMPEVTMSSASLKMEFYASAPGIKYTVQTSDNLSNWVTEGVSLSDINPDGERAATVDRASPRRFIRLVVEKE